MALDSKEMMEVLAGLAIQYGADAVILQPNADRIWEYNSKGKLVKANAPILKRTTKGTRIVCTPSFDKGEGVWGCGVYSKDNVELSEFEQMLPD